MKKHKKKIRNAWIRLLRYANGYCSEPMTEEQKAYRDALLYGSGYLRITWEGEVQHLPIDKVIIEKA